MDILELDPIDNQIVDLLLANGRMSYSDIGEKVGLSRVAVKNRIHVLESKGVIQGYKAIVNPVANPDMAAFVLNVETAADAFDTVKAALVAAPEVLSLVQTTGECHVMGICLVANIAAMRDFVNNFYKQVPGVRRIIAHAILDTIKGDMIPKY